MKKGFDVKDADLSILLTVGSLSTAMAFLGLIYIIVMKGIRFGCILGLTLLVTGTAIELFIGENFNLIYLGHFVSHLGSPVFNIANAKFSSVWFGPKNRPMAITINSMTSTVGIMFAFIVPGIFVSDPTGLTQDEIKRQVFNFHIFLISQYSILLVMAILFFHEAPDNYATY